MADNLKLVAEKRTKLGSAECRRLRKRGVVPGNVYGHQIDPVAVAVTAEQLQPVLQGGHKVVDIEIDGNAEQAMFVDMQWDTFSLHIQHFDLLRVDANERVSVEVTFEIHGMAPGAVAGGVLDQRLRSITVECMATQIPDSIMVNVNELEIGQSLHVRDLEWPEGVTSEVDPDTLVVQVNEPVSEEEADADAEGEIGPAEPEVIGRKEESEDAGE